MTPSEVAVYQQNSGVEPAGNGTDMAIIERVIATGDLSKMTPVERVQYYTATCRSLGLNPLTQPFQYLTLNNKLTLYATRGATDQLRSLKGISITRLERDMHEQMGLYVVTATAVTADGRTDSSTGAVVVKGLGGDALANALMKAETKAKRRVTLSLSGLGWMDETEVETVPAAIPTTVDMETGEIRSIPASAPSRPPLDPVKPETRQQAPDVAKVNAPMVAELVAIAKGKGLDETALNRLAFDTFQKAPIKSLTVEQYVQLREAVNALPDNPQAPDLQMQA